ncbi:MAG TPA: DNA primase [Bacteroidales bacterium]|nr:DNA primase [Bacteroidales bacterium]
MIDQQTIDKIFDSSDIVEVISEFVQLKKSGSNYKGLSPFSNEKTPSFMVSPSKGIFKDFSSGKGGNVVGFLMEHEKLSYPEALKYLARKYHIEIYEKEKTSEDIRLENERESLLVVTAFAQKYFHQTIEHNEEGRAVGLKYLKERGIREDIMEKFQLGYCPAGRDVFTREAEKNGYKTDYLVKTGLTIEHNDRHFDRFSGRVMFPIHSISGTIVGFGGRTLRQDKEVAKYLNSPESEIYHKSRILYGLYFAKKAIVTNDRSYLVEGYTDVLSMHQAGIENVVASSGTALTVEQIRLIKRFTPNITIIYDGDEAGIKASFRGIDLVLEEGMNVKVLLLPEGEDPDSFSKSRSSSEFKTYIDENEKDFITFKTGLLLKDTENDPVKMANLITDIVRSISVIPEAIHRSVYIRECSNILDVGEKILYSEVEKIKGRELEKKWRAQKTSRPAPRNVPSQPQVPAFVEEVYSENEERDIIYFLLKFGKQTLRLREDDHSEITVAAYIIREIQDESLEFKNLVYRKIFEMVSNLIENGNILEDKYFVYHEDPKIQEFAVDIYSSRYELSKVWYRKEKAIELPGDNLGQEVPRSLLAYKSRILKNAANDIDKQIGQAQKKNDFTKIMELQNRRKNLKNVEMIISRELGRVVNAV